MGMACVCEQVFTVKIVHIREGRIGQDTDMDGRKKLAVILSALYVAEKAAEIEKRAVAPVIEMPHLHLQVDQTVVVQFYTHIHDTGLIVNGFSEYDRICDDTFYNFFIGNRKQGGQQKFERFITLLQHCAEHIIVGQAVSDRTGCMI